MEVKLLWDRFKPSFNQLILTAISIKSIKLQYLALDLLSPLFTFLQETENGEEILFLQISL